MKTTRTPATSEPISDLLRIRLLALDFPTFARSVCRLMDALGYEDAHLTGRREWKGYNRHGGGGYDLEATLPGGVAPRRVIAQIKQYDTLAVHQRSVDELRGACLRTGASEGILVTTSAFSEVVRKAAAVPVPMGALLAPVRLMDGEELVGLMIRHRLGVRERGFGRRLVIDEAFFRTISFRSIASPSGPLASRPCSTPRVWHVINRDTIEGMSADKGGLHRVPALRRESGG